jgi:hypothetical protein
MAASRNPAGDCTETAGADPCECALVVVVLVVVVVVDTER